MTPDGFREITPAELALGAELNLQRYRNEVSPFADLSIRPRGDDKVFVDTHYGLTYDAPFLSVPALYGPTDGIAEYGVDQLATMGFLRVPFRRIPRIFLRDQKELDGFLGMIQNPDKNLHLLFRGQSAEYRVERGWETRKLLYGDSEAFEPSLPSSASRAAMLLEEVLPEWCWIIRNFIEQLGDARDGYERLFGDFSLHLFSLALAQHYGLPSAGIDVTPDPSIAVFFAMNSFKRAAQGSRMLVRTPKQKGDEPGVLYVMGVGERFLLDYDSFRPAQFPAGRPDRQKAFFLHTGWGLSRNECARRIWVALYLDPAGRFDMPACDALFPPPGDDQFAHYLAGLAATLPPRLTSYLSRLYWVEG